MPRSHFCIAFVSASSYVPDGPDLRLIWSLSMSPILRILATKSNNLLWFSFVGDGGSSIMHWRTGEGCGTPLGIAICDRGTAMAKRQFQQAFSGWRLSLVISNPYRRVLVAFVRESARPPAAVGASARERYRDSDKGPYLTPQKASGHPRNANHPPKPGKSETSHP